MKYIDSEIILQRKIGPLVYVYIMIIIVIILSLIILFILCYYKTYYDIKGIVIQENEHFYIKVYVPLENVKYIVNNNIVKIENKEHRYNIVSIDNEYFTDNITTYQIVKIDSNLSDKYKHNNLTINLKFLKENKKIIDYIIN